MTRSSSASAAVAVDESDEPEEVAFDDASKSRSSSAAVVATPLTSSPASSSSSSPAAAAPPPPLSPTYPHLGPASLAALEALEWRTLCSHVARLASTSAGRAASRLGLELGDSRERSRELGSLTAAAALMEGELGRELDFGGTSTSRARSAASRAERGGALSGSELVAVASLAAGAVRLSASVSAAASAAGEGDDAASAAEGFPRKWKKPPREGEDARRRAKAETEAAKGGAATLRPLSAPAASLNRAPLRDLAAKLFACLDDDGFVRDSAADGLRAARTRLRTAEARARAAVKGRGGGASGNETGGGSGSGSAAERGGRFCVALPDGAPPPRGAVLLGGGGGVRYWEPPGLVSLNNALSAARAEAAAAEDAARFALSGAVAEKFSDLEQAFEFVLLCDLAAARARYGVWIGGGVLASLHELGERDGAARRGGKARGGSGGGSGGGGGGEGETPPPSSSPSPSPPSPFSVELRDLRQPLLLGSHLLARDAEAAAAKRRGRAAKGGAGGGGGGGGSGGGGGAAAGGGGGASAAAAANRASTAAAAASALAAAGVTALPSLSLAEREEQRTAQQQQKKIPPPPVPIDVLIPSRARVVVVTGPNTGGKTAALKAIGLAALAAAAGVPIPASPTGGRGATARVPWFSRVFADVGDAQSLGGGLSTFSGHLARVSAARREAAKAQVEAVLTSSSASSSGKSSGGLVGDDALFLIDELGTGTDPQEGAALGAALLRALAGADLLQRRKSGGGGASNTVGRRSNAGVGLTLATTHHSSLAALKAQDAAELLRRRRRAEDEEQKGGGRGPRRAAEAAVVVESRFENAAADFDVTSLAPTRKLLWGVPGKSAALDVAASLGLDPRVVEAARGKLAETTGLAALVAAGAVDDGGAPGSRGRPTSLDAAAADIEALRAGAARDRRLAAEARAAAAVERARAAELGSRAEEASAAAALEAASAVAAAVRKGEQALKDKARARAAAERERDRERDRELAAAEAAAAEAAAEAERLAALAARGPWKPRVGDPVFVPRLRSSGTIASLHDGGRQLGIRLGGGALAMTTRVSVEEVERVAAESGTASESAAARKRSAKKGGVPWKRL